MGESPFDEHLDTPAPAADWADPATLDFGAGARSAEAPDVPEVPEVPVTEAEPEPEPEWVPDAPFTPEPPIDGLAPEDDEPLE